MSVSPVYSFINDDRGMTEPYTDLPAIGIVSIGILLFGYLMVSGYQSYSLSAYYAEEKDDLRAIALSIISDPAIASDGCSGLMDVTKLDNSRTLAEMARRYGHPGCPIVVKIEAGGHDWKSGESGRGRSGSYRLPICVQLNDATTVPGLMTITSWERPC